jgi:hypothetical protein
MSGGDLHVAKVDAGIEHRGDEGVTEHVWVHPGGRDARHLRQGVETTRGAVPVHPVARPTTEHRTAGPTVGGPVDRTTDGWRQGHERDLVTFAVHAQDTVPVDLFERLDAVPFCQGQWGLMKSWRMPSSAQISRREYS